MKKLLLIGSIALVLGLLIAGFTTPIFAHSSGDGGTAPSDDGAWEAMHQACENGDWEAMAEAAEEAHGEDFSGMPYHDGDYSSANHMAGMGGHMSGNIMGWY